VSFAVLNFCNAHNSGNMACFNYSVFIHKLEMHAPRDLNFIVKGEDISRSQAVTYTGKVVIFRKRRYRIEMLYQHDTNRK